MAKIGGSESSKKARKKAKAAAEVRAAAGDGEQLEDGRIQLAYCDPQWATTAQ